MCSCDEFSQTHQDRSSLLTYALCGAERGPHVNLVAWQRILADRFDIAVRVLYLYIPYVSRFSHCPDFFCLVSFDAY